MAYRNVFLNPATGGTYVWEINHSDESEFGRDRSIDLSANTGNVGLVKQQGELTPLTFSFTGTILTKPQYDAMWAWFRLCETQSIYFTDFTGDQYEVVITSFKPVRKRGINRRGGTLAPLWYWTYTIDMMVLAVRTGSLVGMPA